MGMRREEKEASRGTLKRFRRVELSLTETKSEEKFYFPRTHQIVQYIVDTQIFAN